MYVLIDFWDDFVVFSELGHLYELFNKQDMSGLLFYVNSLS